jgi:hypothetical protein
LKMFILATFEKIKFGNLKLRNEKFENVKVWNSLRFESYSYIENDHVFILFWFEKCQI